LFAARDALFGLILVAEASEHCVTGQQLVAEKRLDVTVLRAVGLLASDGVVPGSLLRRRLRL
jgi:hypothetical protein